MSAAAARRIFICVQGLIDVGDSIGFDAIHQWRTLTAQFGDRAEVRLFCERFDTKLHPGIPAEPIHRFREAIAANPDAMIVYHFCDGWAAFEDRVIAGRYPNLVVRWHNNTPPWFLAKYSTRHFKGTVNGYHAILRLARETECRFWCNSGFTARQLAVLGIERQRADVVFPASRYLDAPLRAPAPAAASAASRALPRRIVFVGRIVPHKGHRHIILTAAYARKFLGMPLRVAFAGRFDWRVRLYREELIALARALDVDVEFTDEVQDARLDQLYLSADAFLCLSEHEGFGLPIFEAMRAGIPALAWTATATADLMAGHPLSSDALSPRWFAAALAVLQYPELRDYVVRWQNDNALPRYTASVVAEQLAGAVTGIERSADAAPAPYRDSRLDQAIRDRIGAFLAQIGTGTIAEEAALPREIPDNFVTLYDIEAYRSLRRTGKFGRALARWRN
ncbi:MAG TPA: glycosyltransferase [Stellaceae bacterium]